MHSFLIFRLIQLSYHNLGKKPDDASEPKSRVTYSRIFFYREVLTIVLLCVAPLSVHAGFFSNLFGFFGTAPVNAEVVEVMPNAQMVSLLRAANHQDPNPAKGGGDIFVSGDGALVPDTGPLGGADSPHKKESTGEISTYIVREGDTLGQIADMFGVSKKTVLWANDIKNPTTIRPGDTLVILPITGVRHIV